MYHHHLSLSFSFYFRMAWVWCMLTVLFSGIFCWVRCFCVCRLAPSGLQQNTLPSSAQQRQQEANQAMVAGGTLQGVGGHQQSPLVMPVFPLRPAAQAAHTPHYSPYSPSRFHIDKRCQHRCTWKCLSIALILLAVALTAMLAYFAGKNF